MKTLRTSPLPDAVGLFLVELRGPLATVRRRLLLAVLTYDALGRVVEQNVSTTYTQTLYAPTGNKLALMNGQTFLQAFVPLPTGAVAVYESTGLSYYRHADWLSSSRLASTAGRAVYFDTAYAPYGEPYAGSGTTDLSFTGQNQDTVSGLYDFLFREYHGSQGRWISPDPAGLSAVRLTNPQTWNRYGYVENTPTTYTDPLGLKRPDSLPEWGTTVGPLRRLRSVRKEDSPVRVISRKKIKGSCGYSRGGHRCARCLVSRYKKGQLEEPGGYKKDIGQRRRVRKMHHLQHQGKQVSIDCMGQLPDTESICPKCFNPR